MTDPLTLLAEGAPAVPDALPDERAAARTVLDAAIHAEVVGEVSAETGTDRPVPVLRGPALRRWRRTAAGRFAVAATAAAGIAAAVLAWPSSTPTAEAGWSPTPLVMPPDEVAQVDADCHEELDINPSPATHLILVDQRGATALASYRGHDAVGAVTAECLFVRDGDTWRLDHAAWSWMPPEMADDWPTVHLLGGLSGGSSEDSDYAWITGDYDDQVARIDVTTADGQTFETLLDDGSFSVFWPVERAPIDRADVHLYDASGELLASYSFMMNPGIELIDD